MYILFGVLVFLVIITHVAVVQGVTLVAEAPLLVDASEVLQGPGLVLLAVAPILLRVHQPELILGLLGNDLVLLLLVVVVVEIYLPAEEEMMEEDQGPLFKTTNVSMEGPHTMNTV